MENNIKAIRIKSGFSINEIAKKLNVHTSLVKAWELGIDIPSLDQAIVMCGLFNVTIDALFSKEQIETRDFSNVNECYKKIIYEVYKSFLQINKREQDKEYDE